MKTTLATLLWLCAALVAGAQNLFPTGYLSTWDPGPRWTWPPSSRTNHATLTVSIPGTNILMSTANADNVPALQAAITLARTNGILRVPAGTYVFTNTAGVKTDTTFGLPYVNHFTIEGDTDANGDPTTVFHVDHPGGTMAQLMSIGSSHWAGGGGNGFQNGADMRLLTADIAAGATSVWVSAIPPNVVVGGPLWIDQTNAHPEITAAGSGYTNNLSATSYDRSQQGKSNQMHCATVLTITGTNITFRPPTISAFYLARGAVAGGQAFTRSGNQYGHGILLKNIKFTQNTNRTLSRMIWWQATADSSAQNCFFDGVRPFNNLLTTPSNLEFYQCWFRNSPSATVNEGYGIDSRGAGGLLVWNCIFSKLYIPIITANSSGGVIAYNTFRSNYYQNAGISQGGTINVSHGSHADGMLIYQNDVEGRVHADFNHGSSSRMVLYRNRISGIKFNPGGSDENHSAVRFDGASLSNSVVGNVLGHTNVVAYYTITNSGYSRSSNVIYQIGFPNIGNNTYSTGSGVPASNFWMQAVTTAWRHGNFVHSTNGVEWESGSTNRVIPAGIGPFAAAPTWWDTSKWPWPAIGSDLQPMVGYLPSRGRYEGLAASPYLSSTSPDSIWDLLRDFFFFK